MNPLSGKASVKNRGMAYLLFFSGNTHFLVIQPAAEILNGLIFRNEFMPLALEEMEHEKQ